MLADGPVVYFLCPDGGRSLLGSWYVMCFEKLPDGTYREIGLNPGGPWHNYGRKVFPAFNKKESEKALTLAQEWTSARTSIKEWVRDPYGAYQDKRAMDKAVEKVREYKKQKRREEKAAKETPIDS